MRITLSTLGLGTFALADGRQISFPAPMQLDFDFQKTFSEATITRLMIRDDGSAPAPRTNAWRPKAHRLR